MRKQIFNVIIIAALTVFISSCESKKSEASFDSSSKVDTTGEAKLAPTSITFKETTYDFGKVNEGDPVEHTFEFTNTGEHPLVISNATASCGCTVPDWSRNPVLPGKEGKVSVKFDSNGRPGKWNKTVTVLANTEPEATVLNFSVEVQGKPSSEESQKK